MTRLELLKRAVKLLGDPKTMGDGAVLKAIAVSDLGTDEARAALAPLRGYIADVDPAVLATMPEGSFGRELAEFCEANHITLLRPSPTLAEVADARFIAVRYAATHDMVHVLIDEGTDYAGEAAVYAFSCAQGYARMHWVALALACTLWPLARPWQALRIWRAVLRGYRKGRASEMLLANKFEDRFAEPLDDVRKACGVVLAPA